MELQCGQRDGRGRFLPRGPQSIQRMRRAQRQRKHRADRLVDNKDLYEEYLHDFVLPGSNDDYLPASRSSGPLVEIFDCLLKKGYRLGKPERCTRLREFYMDGGHLSQENNSNEEDRVNNTSHAAASAMRNTAVRRTNVLVYKGCRLPCPSRQRSDMRKVRKFLAFAADKKALAANSVEAAETVCKTMLRQFHMRNSEALSQPNGQNANSITALCHRCGSHLGEVDDSAYRHRHDENAVESLAHQSDENQRDPEDSRAVMNAASHQVPSESPHLSEEEVAKKEKLQCLLQMARNDDNFAMVCMLFDDDFEAEFAMHAGVYLSEIKRDKTEPTPLMREVLIYAHWKKFGIPDMAEHEHREKRLRATRDFFVRARVSMGLKSFNQVVRRLPPLPMMFP